MDVTVVGYLRVSSDGQTDGDGYPRQALAVEQFAESRGWHVLAEFYDATRGANDLNHREGLTAAMEFLARVQGRRVIVVEAQNRWARDVIVSEMLLRECRLAGVEVWAANSATDLCQDGEDGTAKFVRQLIAIVDEFDKHRLVHRMRVARQRLKRETNGVRGTEGRKPFGTRDGQLRALRHMRDMRDQGASYKAVADDLNRYNMLTATGSQWSPASVWRVLHNERTQRLETSL